jgi:uncharacterized repeat protein (TIGR04138 family)
MDRDAIFEIVRHDPRYAVEAYEFMDQALCHTQKSVGADPQHHVSVDRNCSKERATWRGRNSA